MIMVLLNEYYETTILEIEGKVIKKVIGLYCNLTMFYYLTQNFEEKRYVYKGKEKHEDKDFSSNFVLSWLVT